MISLDPSWLLALPLLFVMGWVSARIDLRQQRQVRRTSLDRLPEVIEALVAKSPRTASDLLLDVIRENPDDLRLQQALGTLLRDRGEPDRAIEVRLSLLARPSLPEHFRLGALMELARDYLAAGIFDRAEQSLDLLEGSPRHAEANWLKLSILQRQRLWPEALAVADQLVRESGDEDLLRVERFHFLMEQGESEAAARLLPDHARLTTDDSAQIGLFVCSNCGFQARRHGWQCAGCGHWDSLSRVA